VATAREQLAAELKQARLDAGITSQGALAARMTVSRAVVNKAESATQPVPTPDTITGWARVCGVSESHLAELARRCRNGIPDWFIAFLPVEQAATSLRLWGPAHPPGLLQTESYAHALLSGMRHTAEKRAELVKLRMQRQSVLERASVTAVIDYRAVTNQIGTPADMAGQCTHLIELAESGKIGLHVVPPGMNVALGGGFTIAMHDATITINLNTGARDIPTTAPDVVAETLHTFDVVLGAAMSPVPSVEFLRHKEAEWKQQT